MTRRASRLPLLTVGALLFAPALALATPAPARWVAPAPGQRLVGGETTWLEWQPARGTELEEWEVFLSLDDGASYPFRLTPHLDGSRRRVLVEIPPFATERARFLLRYGDEHEETRVEIDGVWRILAPPEHHLERRRRLAATAGEAARPGDAGVAYWEESERDGDRRVAWEARTTGIGGAGGAEISLGGRIAPCTASETDPLPCGPAPRRLAGHSDAPAVATVRATDRHLDANLDRLALQVRRNE